MAFQLERKKDLLFLLFLVVFATGAVLFIDQTNTQVTVRNGAPELVDVPVSDLVLPESMPTRLRIPSINIDTSFVTLGINADQEIEVPKTYDQVGWYEYGPTPGELGPAVVLGHVDSVDGPAVFYSLGQLVVGDRIEIDREDGTTAVFAVRSLKRYEQDSFPTSLVYGDINHAGLRLITCSGSYDRAQHRYDHNLVVYAELVEDENNVE